MTGKTGTRRVPIVASVSYIAQYLDTLNNIKDRDSPLWIAITTKKATKKNPNPIKPIDAFVLRNMLEDVSKAAGITKHVHPHLFRHTRATYYANKLTEQQLKAFFGWTGGSQMAATYVHMSGRDIDDAVLKANGEPPKEEKVETSYNKCPRCQAKMGLAVAFCSACGSPMNAVEAVTQKENKALAREGLMEMVKDPEVKKEFLEYLAIELARKKKR